MRAQTETGRAGEATRGLRLRAGWRGGGALGGPHGAAGEGSPTVRAGGLSGRRPDAALCSALLKHRYRKILANDSLERSL